jgi:hypothetical protein
MRCMNCDAAVAFEKGLFRGKRCKECGGMMLVSLSYVRVLMLLSFLLAELLLWVLNVRALFYPALGVPFGFLASVSLGYPLGFLILTVLVRTVPRVVGPKLVSRYWGPIVTLGLSAKHDVIPRG